MPEPFVLLLKAFPRFQLIYSHTMIRIAPAAINLFDVTDRPDRVQTEHTVSHQDVNLL